MADNTPQNGSAIVTSDEVPYSGDTTQTQLVQVAFVAGVEGSRTLTKAPGDSTDGLLVNLGANNDVTVAGVATAALQGALTETAPTTDIASSGLNGRLQRIAQRLTSLIALLPTALGAGGGLKVDGSGTALPVTGTITAVTAISNALPAGTNNIGDVDVLTLPNVTLAAGTNTNEMVGDVAEDAVLAGNPVRIGGRASAATPTAMSADGDVVTPWADRNGALMTHPRPAATATLANVSGSASSVTLLALNTDRLGVILHNDSTAVLYLKYGSTASTTSYTYKIDPGVHWEMPDRVLYSGIITGIWSAANGSARTTELTS